MTRCEEFYNRWATDPNWCEKTKGAVSQINSYLGLVEKLEEYGLDREFTMVNLPERVARPLIPEKNQDIKEHAISEIGNRLKSEQRRKAKGLKPQKINVKKILDTLKKNVATEQPPIPAGTFNIIYADPPWQYEAGTINKARTIEQQYVTMTLDDIKKLEFPVADDAVLFLWSTSPKLEEALEVLNAWGFDYRTCAVWDKEVLGLGYWFRIQHELLLVGRKGKMPVPPTDARVRSIIKQKRTKHSEKPAIVYDIIERMFPEGNYLELFARKEHPGWTSWGNEVNQRCL